MTARWQGRDTERHTGRGNTGSESGTSGSSGPEFLIVGRIVRPHGVRGEVGMKIITDYPERLLDAQTLYLGEDHRPYAVRRIRRHSEGMILHLEGFVDRETAETLRDALVHIHIDDAVPLEGGQYYLFQIEGIEVVTDAGEALGRLTDLIETGANDVYVVTRPDGGEVLLPAIPEVILNVDVPNSVMTVHLLDGLV